MGLLVQVSAAVEPELPDKDLGVVRLPEQLITQVGVAVERGLLVQTQPARLAVLAVLDQIPTQPGLLQPLLVLAGITQAVAGEVITSAVLPVLVVLEAAGEPILMLMGQPEQLTLVVVVVQGLRRQPQLISTEPLEVLEL
jgi:hypothetical protein